MVDEAGSIEQLQFFRTRVGSTPEQYMRYTGNLVSSAHNPLVLGSNPSGPTNQAAYLAASWGERYPTLRSQAQGPRLARPSKSCEAIRP